MPFAFQLLSPLLVFLISVSQAKTGKFRVSKNVLLPRLKGPKHEIFEIEFFTQIRPVRIGDLGTGEKNRNFVRLSFDSKAFAAYILLSV